jgi:geranylgeranyl pyrophosphate synthase
LTPIEKFFKIQRSFWEKNTRIILDKSSFVNSPQGLKDAILYSLFSSGKCIRGILATHSGLLSKISPAKSNALAASVEFIHCYSLIHDDLPAMDDDDFRRGQPSNHKKFSEATAILAGDGLQSLAFEVLANSLLSTESIRDLANSIGPSGMVGGQYMDMNDESGTSFSNLRAIHRAKTGRLLAASISLPFLEAKSQKYDSIRSWASRVGLLFQITDDILDKTSTSSELGKTAGKDEEQNKATFPALIGLEKSIQLSERLSKSLQSQAKDYFNGDEVYTDLPFYLLNRKK